MKITVLFPDPPLGCAWAVSYGLCRTLTKMGHEVTEYPISTLKNANEIACPYLGFLEQQDLVIISGLEHLYGYLGAWYRHEEWAALKTPKIAWHHETFDRRDVTPYAEMKKWVDLSFFPSSIDAKNLDGEFAPFAADTDVFNVNPSTHKEYHVLFIGSLYPERQDFLTKLVPRAFRKGILIQAKNAVVTRRDGSVDPFLSAKKYAEEINRANIFLNLPSKSSLQVTKVFEVMACGTPLITTTSHSQPPLAGPMFYQPDDIDSVVASLVEASSNVELRTNMRLTSIDSIHRLHTLEIRLNQILEATDRRITRR